MQPITTEELKASLEANNDLKLLMVAGPWEFRARHIPGSVGYPSPRAALRELARDDQIILYATTAATPAPPRPPWPPRATATSASIQADWLTGRPPATPSRATTWPAAAAAGPLGAADTGETCKAAAVTATTAGPGTAGHPPRRPLLSPPAISNPPIPRQLPSPRRSGAARRMGRLAQSTASGQLILVPPWRLVRRRRASPVGSDPGRPPRPLRAGRPPP